MIMKLIQAPIDNKNILEDFTDIFHSGDYVESRNRNQVRQAFYINGKLFEISYMYGYNFFRLHCVEPLDNMQIVDAIREKVKSMNMDDVIVQYSDCGIDKKYSLSGMFYFVES